MPHLAIWLVAFFAVAGVIIRPFAIPEAVWAVSGAILLVVLGLISGRTAWAGIAKGTDVYLFLTGMMLLAETAREEMLFDWLAARATRLANGSAERLFLLIYLVGTFVTTFLSNDATAVVLTPAVAAATRSAKVKNPLPYLFICAFIANAASFVLPISNPANLVIYGSKLPPLLHWLAQYALPSLIAILVTYFLLKFSQRTTLKQPIETTIEQPELPTGGRVASMGIGVTAGVLLVASALDTELGWPTALAGLLTTLIVLIRVKKSPWAVVKGISWSVLPLVAGLFVLVEALDKTGVTQTLTDLLRARTAQSVGQAAVESGVVVAFVCNLVNNLPAGLIAGNVVQAGHVPEVVQSAVLIGVDLGPNLSVTGSLATILWLTALRREGQHVGAWPFLKLGFLLMPIALLLALASLWLGHVLWG